MEGSIEELRDDDHLLFASRDGASHVPGARKRSQRRKKRRRARRLAPLIALVLILGLVVVSYKIVTSVSNRFATPDYSGAGDGFTRIKVSPGDGARDVASAMAQAGVPSIVTPAR